MNTTTASVTRFKTFTPYAYPGRMLFHALSDLEAGDLCRPLVVQGSRQSDVNSLERAWQQLITRHAILRTSFFLGRAG